MVRPGSCAGVKQPHRGARFRAPAPLALLFGLFNLVHGARTLVQGIELRRTRKTIHSAVTEREKTAA